MCLMDKNNTTMLAQKECCKLTNQDDAQRHVLGAQSRANHDNPKCASAKSATPP
jgi:hypothetical protein